MRILRDFADPGGMILSGLARHAPVAGLYCRECVPRCTAGCVSLREIVDLSPLLWRPVKPDSGAEPRLPQFQISVIGPDRPHQ